MPQRAGSTSGPARAGTDTASPTSPERISRGRECSAECVSGRGRRAPWATRLVVDAPNRALPGGALVARDRGRTAERETGVDELAPAADRHNRASTGPATTPCAATPPCAADPHHPNRKPRRCRAYAVPKQAPRPPEPCDTVRLPTITDHRRPAGPDRAIYTPPAPRGRPSTIRVSVRPPSPA